MVALAQSSKTPELTNVMERSPSREADSRRAVRYNTVAATVPRPEPVESIPHPHAMLPG
jgi:hypothetical protein